LAFAALAGPHQLLDEDNMTSDLHKADSEKLCEGSVFLDGGAPTSESFKAHEAAASEGR
jgi:hypothetical protein